MSVKDRVWIASYTASKFASILCRGLHFRSTHNSKEDAERMVHDPQAEDFIVTEYVTAEWAREWHKVVEVALTVRGLSPALSAEEATIALTDDFEARKESWTFADEEQIVDLRAELARERELHQGLRQVVKEYRENPSRVHHSSTCKKGVNYPGLGLCDDRCLICRWADSLLEDKAKPVATNTGEEN
jgi:hypothetical protein